jgi:DNA-binding PadR family transcriptional regulator
MNDLVLLGALLRGPVYGYALKQTAGRIFGTGTIHNNVIYPSLKKFMQNGWVEQATVQGDRGQQRKQYSLTPAGRTSLIEQLGAFGDQEAGDEGAFLLRVALFGVLPKRKREAIVAARKSHLISRAAELSELRKETKPRSFGAAALERVQFRVKDELRWIHQIEGQLEK